MEVIDTAWYWIPGFGQEKYASFQEAAQEWLRNWKKEGCETIALPLMEAEGDDQENWVLSVRTKIAKLTGGCFDEAESVMRALCTDINEVKEEFGLVKDNYPDGCPDCGCNEITVQVAETFTVDVEANTIEHEDNPGLNAITYNCVKCGWHYLDQA